MIKLSDFCNEIRAWTNVDHSDVLITSWVRMAEERINLELRHKDMICRSTANMVDDSTELPNNWLELTSVRYPNCRPHRLVTEDEFWTRRAADGPTATVGDAFDNIYTIIGNTLMVHPVPAKVPQPITISYYAGLAPISENGPNTFMEKYHRLYVFATLALSAPYMVEDERVMVWETEATRLIGMMNEASRAAKYSGSPMKSRLRTFG
jgi:hypothetical protein